MTSLRKIWTKRGPVHAVDFYYQGKRYVRSTTTSDYRLAKRIMRDIEDKMARSTFRLDACKDKHILMSQFLDEYLQFAGTWEEPSTIIREKGIIAEFRRIPGDMDLRGLNMEMLDHWKKRRLKFVRLVTFNIELATMRAILNVAKRWGYMRKNPLDEIRKLKVEEHRLYLTDSELRSVFEELSQKTMEARRPRTKERLKLLGRYFEFLLNTGLRREEALKLDPSDVDREKNVIFIESAKAKEARVVPLTVRARQIIGEIGSELFSPLSKSFVTHGFAQAASKAGLKGMKLHSLRHTFATHMIESGVDVLTLSKILGHSSVQTTMIYAKVRLEGMRKAMNMFVDTTIQKRDGSWRVGKDRLVDMLL